MNSLHPFVAAVCACAVLFLAHTNAAESSLAGSTSGYAQPVKVEAENLQIPAGAAVVEDADASAGKAIELYGEKKQSGSDLITVSFPKAESAGRYTFKLRTNASDMHDLGRGWRAEIQAGNDVVGWNVLHGYHFKEAKGYCDFEVPFELLEPGMQPVVKMFWLMNVGDDGSKPVVRIDRTEMVRTGDLPALQIIKVWPDKIRYLEGQDGTVTVTCRNTTGAELEGVVKVELFHDLAEARAIGEQPLMLAAGESKEISLPLRHGGGKFGYEVRATAFVNGKAVDSASEYFCVSNNPYDVATHCYTWSDGEYHRKDWRVRNVRAEEIFPAMIDGRWKDALERETLWGIRGWLDLTISDEDLAECAEQARRAYVTQFEVFAWSPGGCLDMNPKEEVWLTGDDCRWVYSKSQIIRKVAALKKQGIGVTTYIIPFGQGLESLRLQKEHPEWFCRVMPGVSSPTIDYAAGAAEPDNAKKVRQLTEALQSAPKSGWPKFQLQAVALSLSHVGYYVLNWNRPEVLNYVEDQVIASIKTFDWDGVRWDCGHLNTGSVYPGVVPWKPFTDYQGKPLCNSPDEMVDQTVAHLTHFKARIREVRPNFCFGTNWGWFKETEQYPKMVAELARDGGWFLDEVAHRYSWPEYCGPGAVTWKKYYKVISDQGEYLTSLGGHYNPFGLRPQTPTGSPALWLYRQIFGLAGHSHPEQYLRSKCFPIGDPAQFAVRFGRFLFDTELRKIKEPQTFVTVQSSRPLWWQESVLQKREKGRETWVIHLINPPISESKDERYIEGNVTSALPLAVRDVTVSLKMPSGKAVASAWALTSESWKTGDRAVTQAVPLEIKRGAENVTVSIPEVLFWKVLVFEFK